jgi:hypothetical protein
VTTDESSEVVVVMDATETRLFAEAVRDAVARHGGGAVDDALREVGWRAALSDDPVAATRAVFDVLGELNLASTALDDVLLQALGLDVPGDRAAVLSPLGSHQPPATYDRATLTIAGLGGARLASATQAVVAIDGGKQHFLATVDVATLEVTAAAGIDPAGGWHSVTGQAGITQLTAVDWPAAVVAGQLALAQQLTAATRAMLGIAREHALNRTQFDRPVASFQAVRHKLAESYVAVEVAAAALDAGWADPTPFTATMAKMVAGTTAKTVARHAQQVLAGMGFTSEHPFHHYFKRTLVLDQLLGSSPNLRQEVGMMALERKEIPPLLPL